MYLNFAMTVILCVERILKRCKKSSCCNHFIDVEMTNENMSQRQLNI